MVQMGSKFVQNSSSEQAINRGSSQVQVLETDQAQKLSSSHKKDEDIQQMQLQRSLTGERTLEDGKEHDQSSKSKSKNKLRKKRRDALKKKMEQQKENSKGNPSLIDDNLGSPIPSNQDTIVSQKSKINS
ncbi:hypothetical protein HAX54_022080 [Datura stramonium]|uniref:Uncharacterized protein n=1 Tax=Datura stramonium TaxID=4076 RepID=A0ABS8UTV5_DATST|nr:hypothetical protein [Datura stramonium]